MSELNLEQGSIEAATAIAGETNAELVERNLAYWQQRLAGIPAILELPTDRPRPPMQSFRSARHSLMLSECLKQALLRLSAEEGRALPTLLLAEFQTLLTRYTRQDDIVVGSTLQDLREVAPEDFTPVPVRTDMSGDPGFRELLSRVHEAEKAAREHQDVPWESLVEAAQTDGDASRNPLFQAQFEFQSSSLLDDSEWKVAGPAVEGDLKVDLHCQVREHAERLTVEFTYATDLFDASTIARMSGHFERLLEGVIENSNESIARLPLLTETEHHQLVVEWNNTGMEYPRTQCVHQLFETQAARTPDIAAVVFEGKSLTYAELDRRSTQLAHHLIQLGATPDSLVGICLERSLDMVVGLLGILKAGAAYVPLDPAYPRDRIAYMLENSELPILLTQASLKDTLPSGPATVVLIDSDWNEIGKQSAVRPDLKLDPENRAYVIYTSGSTGKPKGVEVLHRAVVNFLTTMAKEPGLAAGDRLLAITTLSFDIAGLEIYLPLTQGASLEIVSREVAADGRKLLSKLNTSGATVMQATPATWRMLLEAGWTGDRGLKILIGGEAVSQKLATQLLERSSSVWNVYGPTETTIWSTTSELKKGLNAVTIGRPIGNTEIFILDKVLQPVPIGVAGELHIGGDGLARGYLKRPELTAEKFIPHPFHADPKARLYKTGDLVRYLPNGNIEFLGRIDHQVKIRGFRIELGEIEAVLRQHPAIGETVVVAREDTPGDKRVVAYFVAVGGKAPTTAELRSFMKKKLPEYMLPSVFAMLKSMPLTPNGKVDRRALPAPAEADLAPQGEFAAPTDAVEAKLVKIWENLLNVRPIGIRDNYFELGGHSLVAVRLMNQIEEAFGKNLPIATMLQAPTIEQLAAILRQKDSRKWSCLVPIQSEGTRAPFFCIHGANGAVVRFLHLAQYLGADQPFYGIQAQGLDPAQPPHARIEEMASLYVKEVRRVQPHGPYFLGGYSMGGMIAFEMAQQILAESKEEATVVLFDTNLPIKDGEGAAKATSTSTALLQVFELPAAERGKYLSRIATAPVRAIQRRLLVAKLPSLVKKVRKACLQAEADYAPKAYGGRVILFRSNHKPLGQVIDPRARWSEYATRGLEKYEVQGNHENILLEPQVRSVAKQLKTCLENQSVSGQSELAAQSKAERMLR
jgi:amino acid adenylation domain-containing protein